MGRSRPISVGWANPAHYQMGWLLCLSTVISPPSAAERELIHVLHANEGGWRANGGDRAARDYLRWRRGGAAGGVGTVAMVAVAGDGSLSLSLSLSLFCFSSFSSLLLLLLLLLLRPLSSLLFYLGSSPFSLLSFFSSSSSPVFIGEKQGGTSWWWPVCCRPSNARPTHGKWSASGVLVSASFWAKEGKKLGEKGKKKNMKNWMARA